MSKSKVAGLVLYYFVNATWGILMTLCGVLVALAMLVSGHKPHVFHHVLYFEVKEVGGVGFGAEIGCVFLVTPGCDDGVKLHECGHGVQNFMFGPGMVFISIASAIRFWVRQAQAKKGKELKPYEAIWFEAMATSLGNKYFIEQ